MTADSARAAKCAGCTRRATASPVTSTLMHIIVAQMRDAGARVGRVGRMDPVLLAQLHGPRWDLLERLAKKSRLDAAEAADFLGLYRLASKDLSRILSVAPDSQTAARLSVIVHRARTHLTSIPRGPMSAFVRFA